MYHITHVIPFRLESQPGVPIYEQVVFAAKKAILSGRFRPGDAFPSVRALSKAMKIHANTAQKVIAHLQQEGFLEVRPGIGTVVGQPPAAGRTGRARLLRGDAEALIVEALKHGVTLPELQGIIADCWVKLQQPEIVEKA